MVGRPELGTGVVRFHGKVKNNPATFIGLEFPRPLGKNNGSSNGVVYFECPDNHGLFVKEDAVVLVKRAAKGGAPATTGSASSTPVAAAAPAASVTPAAPVTSAVPSPSPRASQVAPPVAAPVAPAEEDTANDNNTEDPSVAAGSAAVKGGDEALQRRVHLLETQLEELKLEKEEMQLDKEDADIRLAELDELKTKAAEAAALKQRIAALEAENAKLAAAPVAVAAPVVAVAPISPAHSEAEVAALRSQLEQKAAEAENKSVAVAKLTETIAAKESELEALKHKRDAELAEREKQMAELKRQAAIEMAERQKESLHAKRDSEEKEIRIAELSQRLSGDASAQAAAWKEKDAELAAQVEAARATEQKLAHEMAAKAEAWRVREEELTAAVAAKEKEKEASAAAAAAAQASLAKQKEQQLAAALAQKQSDIAAAQRVAADAEAKLVAEHNAYSEVQKELEAQIAKKQKEADENRKSIEELTKKSTEQAVSGQAMAEKLADKENKVAELNRVAEEASARAAKAEASVQERDRKLQEQVATFDAERARLKSECESANVQVASLRAAAESQAGNKELMATFQKEELRLKEQLQTALASSENLASQVSQLKTSLEQATSLHKIEMDAMAARAKADSDRAADEMKEILARHKKHEDGLEKQIAAGTEANEALGKQVEEGTAKFQSVLASQKAEADKISSLMKDASAELAKERAAKATLTAQMDEFKAAAEQATSAQAAAAEKAAADAKELIVKHQREEAALKQSLANAGSSSETLLNQITQLQASVKDITAVSAQKEAEAQQIRAQLEAATKELSVAKAESKNRADEAEDVAKKLQAAAAALESAQLEHKQALEAQNVAMDQQREALTRDHTAELDRLAKEANSGAAQAGESFQKELELSRAHAQTLKQAVAGLQSEVAQERAKYATLSADHSALEARVAQTEALRASLQQQLDEAQQSWEKEKEENRARDAARVAAAEEAMAKNKAVREQHLQQSKDEVAKAREEAKAALNAAKEAHAKELAQLKKSTEEALAKAKAEKEEAQGQDELKEALEIATVDKELLEERIEEMESRFSDVSKELEELRAERNARAVAAQNVDVAALPEAARLVQDQNTKLAIALQKIKQLMDEQAGKAAEQIKLLKDENELVPMLEEQVSSLEKEISGFKEREAELKEALEERSGLDEMVEKLSDEKMTLQDKLLAAEAAVVDMEELHELSKEIEENQRAEEAKLLGQLRAKEVQLLDANSRIQNAQTQANEAAATILKFRSRIAALSADMEALKSREAQLAAREQELENLSSNLRQSNIRLQASVDQDRSATLQAALSQIRSQQSSERLQLILSLLPEGFFRTDLDAIVLLLAVRRLRSEAQLLATEIKDRGTFKDEPLYGLVLSGVLADLAHCSLAVGVALEDGDQDHVETSAVLPLVSRLQNSLADLIEMVRVGTLTVAVDVSSFSASVSSLRQFVTELHPDAPRPNAQVQVAFDLNAALRLCSRALLVENATAPTRFVERFQSVSVAAAAALQHSGRDAVSVYPDSLRIAMEEQLASGAAVVDAMRGAETAEEWAELDAKLIGFVEAVNKIHDEMLVGGFSVAPAGAAVAVKPAVAGWQLRVMRVRDEIVRLLEMQTQLTAAEAAIEAEKERVEAKDKELSEAHRQVIMLTKKVANAAKKEEVLRSQMVLKDGELEQLRVLEAALATTQKEMSKLEQEKRMMQLQLQDTSRSSSTGAEGEPSKGRAFVSGGVPMHVFDREMQRYKDAITYLSERLADARGADMKRNLGFDLNDPLLGAPPTVPAPALSACQEIGAERLKLRMAAASAQVVDLTDRARKTVWVERAKEEQAAHAVKTAQLTAAATEALRLLGPTGRTIEDGVEGKTLVARVRVGSDAKQPARVVKVAANKFVSVLLVK